MLSLLGFFVFLKSKNAFGNILFSFICFVSFIWLFCYSFAYNSHNKNVALIWFKLGYPGIVMLAAFFFHFTVEFLHIKKIKFFIIAIYSIAIVMIFLIWSGSNFISGVDKFFWGYYPLAGIIHPFFLAWFFLIGNVCFCLLAFSIFFGTKRTFLIKRKQTEYILLAFCIYITASVDFLANYKIVFYPFGYLPTFFFTLIISYAIARYRVMDIATAITRTSIFIITYSLVLGIPFIIAVYMQQYFVHFLGDSWWIVPLISSTLLATVGPFFYLYINKKAEDKLLKEQRAYQNVLRNASSGMIRIKDLKLLLNLIVRVVAKTVRIKYVSIYLLDKQNNRYVLQATRGKKIFGDRESFLYDNSPLINKLKLIKEAIVVEEEVMKLHLRPEDQDFQFYVEQLLKMGAALIVPSFIDNYLMGILVLGEKISGKLYSSDDLVVFSVLANQAALAIENAQFYDEIKQTNEQLFQAEKMATIGTMADGLSHQINNRFHALSLIAGDSLDMLKTFDWAGCNEGTKQVMTDLKSALERIENNVLQGGEIVKGILKYSRPGDTGFESVDFKDVLNGAIEMLQYKIRLKEIDLVQNIPADLPKLHGNLAQLQEVFFNLIDNGYDAIKERQMILKEEGYRGKIEITAGRSSNSLEIIVTDNGIGVKDLDKKKLFTPFFTTKATAKKGTGLGLYVIEKIIASHNGKIDIESTYKSGTRFIIILPTAPLAT